MEIWVYNRLDDGKTTAMRPAELPSPERPYFLKFKFLQYFFRILIYVYRLNKPNPKKTADDMKDMKH